MPFWYAILTLVFFVLCGTSWILFGRLTMGRIERQIRKENLKLPANWDSLGYRIFGFARAVVFDKRCLPSKDEIMVDTSAIRRFVTPRDRVFALIFMAFTYSFVAIVMVGVFFFNVQG